MESVTGVQILDSAVSVSLHTNGFRNGINPSIHPQPLDKCFDRLVSLTFRVGKLFSSSSSSSSCRAASTDIPDPLSCHFSLSFITSGRSSGLHPVSSHSCCIYVRAGRPAFVRPYVGVYRSTSLMSLSLLLQQCPACLVRLTWIVFVMGGRWSYSWCLVGCCRQDLFNIARSILV